MRHRPPRARQRATPFLIAALLCATVAARPLHQPTRHATTIVTGAVRGHTGRALEAVAIAVTGRPERTTTGADGRFVLRLARTSESESIVLVARRVGFERRDSRLILRGDSVHIDIQLAPSVVALEQTVTTGAARAVAKDATSSSGAANAAPSPATPSRAPTSRVTTERRVGAPAAMSTRSTRVADVPVRRPREPGNTEAYDPIAENMFRSPRVAAMSTFSVDVDRASYSNVRRFLSGGSLPPRDAVRIEELVNYFPYDDPTPDAGAAPLRITTEIAPAPWNTQHDLVRIALRARDVDMRRAPASNLVFLVDVSGSMSPLDRLPLVKESLRLLVNELREEDRVAIVVYAGQAGLVLPSTPGSEKHRILAALDALGAGGSTAGGAGIRLAYDVARQNFIRGGNNRVILCTDGDFNVGQSSDGALVQLIEDRRREGAFLTILGYGMGNYKDAKMEKLAGAGNGNYGYIDDLLEARKMLVTEMGGTLHTVAKDVKLQVEFNPERVQAYRLLGYEDRLLRDEDFSNDARDAGDVGAGHTVTALYEIVRSGVPLDVELHGVTPLRYQRRGGTAGSNELLHVAMRYKSPDGDRSVLVTHPVRAARGDRAPSEAMRFSSAVAGFGMLLRQSPNSGSLTWPQVVTLARGAQGADADGYRAEFVRLAELAAQLSRRLATVPDAPDR